MLRLTLAAFGCLCCYGLTAAPVPKEQPKPTLYFPTVVGTKWVDRIFNGNEITRVVTAVKQKPDERAWLVTVGGLDAKGKIAVTDTWEISEKGNFYLDEDREQKPVRRCHLKLPALIGEKWDPYLGAKPKSEFRSVTLKSRRIKIPAGEFDAIGVERWHGDEVFGTCWYAAGVGLVKSEIGGGDDKETWMELKSFTPGKK
jgi:hypothetical protein